MPRVPTYEGNIQEQAIPVPQRSGNGVSQENFGGGETAQRLSATAISFAMKAKEDADQVAVLDADRQLAEYETKRLYDPQTGALNKKGKDSFGVVETTLTDLDKDAGEIEAKLANPSQKEAFRQRFASRKADINRTLERHVGAEMMQFDFDTAKSFRENRRNNAIANYTDMGIVEKSMQESQAAMADLGKRNGKPKEWIGNEMLNASSEIALGVLNRMLDGNMDQDAKEFFKENREHFNAQDLVEAEKQLKHGTTKAEALRISDELFDKYADKPQEMRAALREIKDEDVRLAAREFINENIADRERDQRMSDDQVYKGLYNTLTANGGDIRSIYRQMRNLEPSKQEYLKQIAENMRSGKNQTDPKLDWELTQMATNPATRAEFKKINFNDPKYMAGLSQERRQYWQGVWSKSWDDKAIKQLTNIKDTLESIYAEAKLPIPTRDTAPGSPIMNRYQKYKDAIQSEINRTGDDSDENITNIARRMVKEDILKDPHWKYGLFGQMFMKNKSRRFEIDPAEIDIDTIKPENLKFLREALSQAGQDPNNLENIREAYKQALQSGAIE